MLISKVDSESAGENNSPIDDYQTANELFELMARDHNFENMDNELSTRDLVLLYKNTDIGTSLIANANEFNNVKRPNQHVETVIYADDPESDSSDISDIYTADDMDNIFTINKERIDLLRTRPSYENTVCHKFGDLELQASQLSTDYDKYFLFKDPYIKQQLKSMSLLSDGSELAEPVLPPSLLDYICCKRLENNYNFHMDNIIRYVKHTIDQLRRISNGDYLTDRAKEKWREVDVQDQENTKALATCTSIPLHVERKTSGHVSNWDDIVHSEVDVRSLSRILEKKIVLEIPKLICGTYKLYSKLRADNVLIRCKREKSEDIKDSSDSQIDVVLQLQRAEDGQVMSNISSIMILQPSPIIQRDMITATPLLLPYIKPDNKDICKEASARIVEVDENYQNNATNWENGEHKALTDIKDHNQKFILGCNGFTIGDKGNSFHDSESIESSDVLQDMQDNKEMLVTNSFNIISPDEFRLTMQRLNMQTSLPEESIDDLSNQLSQPVYKTKSPMRVRIKSPYENKSHALEEKKRKKLLEIRERRERKKKALGENCKINKHYGKSANMPQSSSSVTKLSITNKSFYNSIYGQNLSLEEKPVKGRLKNMKKEIIPEISLNAIEDEYEDSSEIPENNSKKYIDRSYYLDETETEMMYLTKNQTSDIDTKNIESASTSAVSNDFKGTYTLFSQLIDPCESNVDSNIDTRMASDKNLSISENNLKKEDGNANSPSLILNGTKSSMNVVTTNTPKDNKQPKKTTSAVECRESINQIYNLMKQIKNNELNESALQNESDNNKKELNATHGSSTIQGSDSGTSLKHYQTSSVPSCYSFSKANIDYMKQKSNFNKNLQKPTAVVPRVIINTRQQSSEIDKLKKDKRLVINPTIKVPENPLKAISQLLHEFENVQKIKQKGTEPKVPKKNETTLAHGKSMRQNNLQRRIKVDENKEGDIKNRNPRAPLIDVPRTTRRHVVVEEKRENVFRKKLADIIDQAKEARGEAVRGPSKFPSRLNELAQPKRSFIQANSEQLQSKYGRNPVSGKLQRLPVNSFPVQRYPGSAGSKNRIRKSEGIPAVPAKLSSSMPPLDRGINGRYSVNNTIYKAAAVPSVEPSYKHNVPVAPENLKRMVGVESYVNSHYGSPAAGDSLQQVQKSRIPLLPIGIGQASETSNNAQEKSSELGSKLHQIIDTIVKANPPEGLESSFKCSINNIEDSFNDRMSKGDEHVSLDSDYQLDIFQDKNVKTAVNDLQTYKTNDERIIDATDSMKFHLHPFISSTGLHNLDNALCRRMSVGDFNKRLRLKSLTLTPKQSILQMFALQSGDAGSAILKTTHSQNVKVPTGESFCELKSFPVLSNTHVDWRFTNFPIQITTVGYSFPEVKKTQCKTKSQFVSLGDIEKKEIGPLNTYSKIINKACQYSISSDEVNEKDKCVQVDLKSESSEEVKLKSKEVLSDDFKTLLTSKIEPANKLEHKTAYVNNPEMFDDVDYTASLDMLVGILNEIKKITSCQSNIANSDNSKQQSKEAETMLNNYVALESSDSCIGNPISLPLDKINQLQSRPSINTFYLSHNGNSEDMKNPVRDLKPVKIDKEVDVDFIEREYVNNFTDVPSQFLPVTLNHSTNITNSLIGILSEPSEQSLFSFAEFQTYAISSFESSKKIIELPPSQKCNVFQESLLKKATPKSLTKKDTCMNLFTAAETVKVTSKQCTKNNLKAASKTCVSKDFDSVLKMKRDILVTFYSILVFTVFAALSFPEIMNNV